MAYMENSEVSPLAAADPRRNGGCEEGGCSRRAEYIAKYIIHEDGTSRTAERLLCVAHASALAARDRPGSR